jgi:hypothetical protein
LKSVRLAIRIDVQSETEFAITFPVVGYLEPTKLLTLEKIFCLPFLKEREVECILAFEEYKTSFLDF